MAEAAVAHGLLHTFSAGNLSLSAKRWGREGGKPVIALHGWLDNCASFDYLAPLLEGCDVVCLDGAGHARSDWRNHLGAYNIWQDIAELFAVADQLGWREFSVIGHSRGAMVAFLAAGTFPERISHLVMIEGACPRVAEAESAAANLAESIRLIKACMQRPRNIYGSFDKAVAARERGMFPLSHSDALVLARQGVESIDEGFSWRYDPKLLAGSELKLNAQQVDSFYRRISTPCLLVMAAQGLLANDELLAEWLQSKSEWSIVILPGGHHLHMSEQCVGVASTINHHFTARPTHVPH